MSIRLKLIIMFMALALIPSFIIGILAFTNYKRSLETNKLYELKNIATFKADKIETYFNDLKTDLQVVQNSYVIKNNLNTLVQLSDSPTNPTFIAAKKRVDEILKKTQLVLGLSNIILTDTKGKIVYFSNHKHNSGDIYNIFSRIGLKTEKDKVYFSDVFLNEEQEKKLALLVAVPAFDSNGRYSGIVAFESDASPIYKLIQDVTGLGKTGETLIGKKIGNKVVFLNPLRHVSGLSRDISVNIGELRAQAIQRAVNRETGMGQLIDYRGEKVIAAWQPLSSTDWGVVAKMDAKEAFAAVTNLRSVLIVTMIIIFILSWVMAVSISESISAPIKKLSKGADIIGSGNLDHSVIIDQKDEIGSLSQSLTRMTRNLKDMTASRDELDREINNRKIIEQYLRQSEIKYRGLIELSPDAIFVNQENSVVLVNKSALDLFGAHSPEQILGKSPFELFHSDSQAMMSDRINLLLKGETVPIIEEKIVRMDGDVRVVELTAAPFTNEDRQAIQVILHDITERKNIENALIQSRMEWIETFNTIPDLIAIMDNQHRIVRANKAMADKLGMSPSDLEGLHCYEFVHGTNEPPLFCPHRTLLNDGKEHEAEIHEMKLGGDFLVSVTPILDKNGVVKGALHVAHDITERIKKEQELQKLNRTLKAISNINQAALQAKNENDYLGRICNIVIEDCGYSLVWIGFAEDDENKTVRPMAQAGFDDGYLEKIKVTWSDKSDLGKGPTGTAIRTGKPNICSDMNKDLRFKPWLKEAIKRGYASSLSVPLMTGHKALGAITIYSRQLESFFENEIKLLSELADDIVHGIVSFRLRSSRDEAENRLKKQAEILYETRNYLEKLINFANAPIICWDSKFKITMFNHAFERLTGYNADEVIGEEFNMLFPEKNKEESLNKIDNTLKGEYWDVVEIPILQKSGGIKTVLWNSANVYAEGGDILLATIAQGQDITERKKAEEILKRDKDSLEKLVKAGSIELAETQIRLERTKRLSDIGALAATVAHELRNPLAAINISSAIIKRKTKDEHISRYISNIEKSVIESDQIINNLLYYSRIKPPYLEDVSIYGIIEECLGSIKTKTKKTISIKKEISLLKDISITADPLQIKEVFNNILNNAYDAVPEKKGKIALQSSYNGKFVKISIKDNGVGIDKGDLERVFNPFFTTKAKGTGLGLSVCKQIVKMHGGTIDIQSEEGHGTMVNITLPKKKRNRSTTNA